MDDDVVAWLLSGDVAVRYRAMRDLLGRDDTAVQTRIASEGDGAALLRASGGKGHWGKGFYQPKWTSTQTISPASWTTAATSCAPPEPRRPSSCCAHHLYRSERSGEAMRPEFTRLHHPARWHFDILRGLESLVDSGTAHDPRMDDALRVLESRRGPDGRWAANSPYPGETHLPPPRPGEPSRWITLIASKVLEAYPVSV